MQERLVQIYNTLATIDTHGDGTLRMASCLNALQQVIENIDKQSEKISTVE